MRGLHAVKHKVTGLFAIVGARTRLPNEHGALFYEMAARKCDF